jgi:hypothetical protein
MNHLKCGASASNARSVCEPCPGGSRLECSDVSHNCFAGITGCKNAFVDPSIDTGGASSSATVTFAPSPSPSGSDQAYEVHFQPTDTPSLSPVIMPNMTHLHANDELLFVSAHSE